MIGPCTRCHATDRNVQSSKYAEGKFCPSCYGVIFNAGKEGKPIPPPRPRKGSDINIGICIACDKAGVHVYELEDVGRVCAECFEAAKIADEDGASLPRAAVVDAPEPVKVPPPTATSAAVLVQIVCRDMAALHRILAAAGSAVTVTPYADEVIA